MAQSNSLSQTWLDDLKSRTMLFALIGGAGMARRSVLTRTFVLNAKIT
jgi:hypothetical protein